MKAKPRGEKQTPRSVAEHVVGPASAAGVDVVVVASAVDVMRTVSRFSAKAANSDVTRLVVSPASAAGVAVVVVDLTRTVARQSADVASRVDSPASAARVAVVAVVAAAVDVRRIVARTFAKALNVYTSASSRE